MSGCLGRFVKRSGVLPTTQFAYWKGLGTCDALLSMSHTLQSALEKRQEARIVQIDFNAPLTRLTIIKFDGIAGSVLSILGYLDTWSGFEAAMTAPWPSRGLHHCDKFLEPSDECAGRGCYCFLMR